MAEVGGLARRPQRTVVGDEGTWPELAAPTADCDGECVSRVRRGETSGGSSGFVRTPIAALLVSMASSRREEHDGGLGCRKLSMVRKLWVIY